MSSHYGLGFNHPIHALILGGSGGVGSALASLILRAHPDNQVILTSRSPQTSLDAKDPRVQWYQLDITQDIAWRSFSQHLQHDHSGPINFIFNATGLLHNSKSEPPVNPEKSLRALDLSVMQSVFAVNTYGVALALKYLTPLLPRTERSVFATCSARVGSIGDNRLGGWYSYRASKAAQHMLVKTAAIELSRNRREHICVALHPGTVNTALSQPFSRNVPPSKLFTPEYSASSLAQVVSELTPEQTGLCFAWDGSIIPW